MALIDPSFLTDLPSRLEVYFHDSNILYGLCSLKLRQKVCLLVVIDHSILFRGNLYL